MPETKPALKPFVPLRKRPSQYLIYAVAAALVIVFGFFAFPEQNSFWMGMMVLVVVVAGYALVMFLRQGFYDLQRIQTADDWSKLNGEEFVHLTAEIYRRQGYRVTIHGAKKGQTVGYVVAHKGGQTSIIRVNPAHQPASPAELDALQIERQSRRAEGAVLISRHGFSSSCTEQARAHKVELLEGRQFYRTLQSLSPNLKDKGRKK